jgi:hypothetical protein
VAFQQSATLTDIHHKLRFDVLEESPVLKTRTTQSLLFRT